MEKEKRKIVKIRDAKDPRFRVYAALKPARFGNNEEWERRGSQYGIKGIYNLGKEFELVMDDEIKRELKQYEQALEKQKADWQKIKMAKCGIEARTA